METVFRNKRISGILGILPETSCDFEEEMRGGATPRNLMIKRNMGYGKRYRAKKDTTTAQLCIKGMQYLLEKGYIEKEEIGAILVISFSPDYYVPHISNQIHGAFELPVDILTVDSWAGCSGYIKGLMQAFCILEALDENKKVLLFTGDVRNRLNGEKEIYDTPPYGGDGASITIVENTEYDCEIPFMMKTNGEAGSLVSNRQGAYADLYHTGKCDLHLDTARESFLFYQQRVPDLVQQLADYAHVDLNEVEHFFFIQANELSVRKIADKLAIDKDRVSMDLVAKYGDMSATLNPIGIVDHYGSELLGGDGHFVLICGYGLGAEWGGAFLTLNNFIFCENITTDL